MKTNYIYNNDVVNVLNFDNDRTLDKLKPIVYSVNYKQNVGFFLNIVRDKFTLPTKIYGEVNGRCDRVVNTYLSRDTSLGVLLTGLKGSGKTLLMKTVANEMLKRKIPVVMVNDEFSGDEFFNFIDKLGECCILFDEFAKVYNSDGKFSQDTLLSLFDGVQSSKRMFILSENNKCGITDYLINRPSRVYYHYHYDSISKDTIKEYCIDQSIPLDFIKSIVNIHHTIDSFNFDILQSIVSEYKLYNENVHEIIDILNISVKKRYGIKLKLEKLMFKDSNVDIIFHNKDKIVNHYINEDDYINLLREYKIPLFDECRVLDENDTVTLSDGSSMFVNEFNDIDWELYNNSVEHIEGDTIIASNDYIRCVFKEVSPKYDTPNVF